MSDKLEKCSEFKQRIYLPSQEDGVDIRDYINRYMEEEFPPPIDNSTTIYSIPREYQWSGQHQACLAEQTVFERFKNIQIPGLWLTFFHNTIYGGKSYHNQRLGKLIIREHDFVVFVKYQQHYFILLIEVKSSTDQSNEINNNLEKISNCKMIKNNKRSAEHQLRDHVEILQEFVENNQLLCYIMWPFLSCYSNSRNNQQTKRWKDENFHVFKETLENQRKFDDWLVETVLSGRSLEENCFITLFNRFLIQSCSVFVDEIDRNLLLLLTQEQYQILNSNNCRQQGTPLIVHGAAGTGKTLLVLKKLEQLYHTGRLDANNRALVIFYWPGIRCEMELKLEELGIREYVDTSRYFVSSTDFLKNNKNNYKHIFMDEAEALCVAFDGKIIEKTLATIYQRYHYGNCSINCKLDNQQHDDAINWGELWFMVDTNQISSLFLPKHSPKLLKTPSYSLTKIIRSTGSIFEVFQQFYTTSMQLLPKTTTENIKLGHNIKGPPIYWVNSTDQCIDRIVAEIIINLCSTKGFKPRDLCVLPFLVNERLIPDTINKHIDDRFVENTYRPIATTDVEFYLNTFKLNYFLIPWILRVKGLEFKVVIIVIEDDDFDTNDFEDKRKLYIMASRCTTLLIVVCNQTIRKIIDVEEKFVNYPIL